MYLKLNMNQYLFFLFLSTFEINVYALIFIKGFEFVFSEHTFGNAAIDTELLSSLKSIFLVMFGQEGE